MRAAVRILLSWVKESLAEAAGASRFHVRRLSAIAKLRSALESADIVFLENDGEEKGLRRTMSIDRLPALAGNIPRIETAPLKSTEDR